MMPHITVIYMYILIYNSSELVLRVIYCFSNIVINAILYDASYNSNIHTNIDFS